MIYFLDKDGNWLAAGHLDCEIEDRKKREVHKIQADGHELERIHNLIHGLPNVMKRVVVFPQPWASLIAENWNK